MTPLPCHCGKQPIIANAIVKGFHWWVVKCHCGYSGPVSGSEKIAVDGWNFGKKDLKGV